jgi:hypothetical protein
MAQSIAMTALVALGFPDAPFHEPFHADGRQRSITVTGRSDWAKMSASVQVPQVMWPGVG